MSNATKSISAPIIIIDGENARFEYGRFVITPGAMEAVSMCDMNYGINRHLSCDWGDVDRDDWEENDLSLRQGFRLLSAYRTQSGVKFWIITEADRSVTTVLLPSEY